MAAQPPYSRSVFINCPFDEKYKPIFDAIVFAVFECGFVARCTLEYDDGTTVRMHRLLQLIKECQYSIHDISRVHVDQKTRLPRFNMPLELGLFLAAKAYGTGNQKRKACVILDTERYRYQAFISDIAGQDPHAHNDEPKEAVKAVRDWLVTTSRKREAVPGSKVIWKRYQGFRRYLPSILSVTREINDLTFVEYTHLISEWLKANP